MASPPKSDLLPGTLDGLILATLSRESLHGDAIAQRIEQDSGEVLRTEEGSLYPALQRLLIEGWVTTKWSTSANKRRVRVYAFKSAGRKHLSREREWVNRAIE
ncbi:MAG: PadR family transcriptional regulator [Bryobacteraceae bacterium]